MYVNFQQNRVSRSLKTVQLAIILLKKWIITDMPYRIEYMDINFQQNQVTRSAKTVHINLF